MTLDMWEDKYRRRPYITFTYHYINEDFNLIHLTLATRTLKPPHTGEAISEAIFDIKEEFQLNTKEIFAVSDAGRNVKKGICLAGLENENCRGHAVHNLVLTDGIKTVPEIQKFKHKMEKAVTCIRYHPIEFEKECDEEERIVLQRIYDVEDCVIDDIEKQDQADVSDKESNNLDTEEVEEEIAKIAGDNTDERAEESS